MPQRDPSTTGVLENRGQRRGHISESIGAGTPPGKNGFIEKAVKLEKETAAFNTTPVKSRWGGCRAERLNILREGPGSCV